ncbi:MAG: acetolactate decarboxylase [Spirochaetales bacterium]|nr:acetolactate decarboxylase [Spirochaetales bacterium]
MKRIIGAGFIILALVTGCSTPTQVNRDIIYQTSAINALFSGMYDGAISFKELKTHGDFIIGTFDALDGELLGFDNHFYQVKADGKVYPVSDEMTTPFAVVTYFDDDTSFSIDSSLDLEGLEDRLLEEMNSKNIFQAIKIEGNFNYVKTRSVPRQSRPYPQLIDVLKNQPTFEFRKVKGTIVGFWTPGYISEINVSGFHFHYQKEATSFGGGPCLPLFS